IDGRNMPLIMFSRPPHIGGVYRAPAGIFHGITRGTKPGTVFIDNDSPIIKHLKQLLLKKSGQTIFYGYDSHLGCAARGQIHARRGGSEDDGGLRSDVMSKLMLAQGLLEVQQQLVVEGLLPAEVIPTFFSFDPHSGFVIAGLEIHADEEHVAKEGYSNSVLTQLITEKKIFSTEIFLQDSQVQNILARVLGAGSADFRLNYSKSLLANWQAITTLYDQGQGELYTKILTELTQIYQKSGWKIDGNDNFRHQAISERALKQKAKFLLKNLITRYSIAGTGSAWPFDHHQEELAVITEGGYAPFPSLDAFSVFSQDLDSLILNTQLAVELIRTTRSKGEVTDPTNTFQTTKTFTSAPVFISNKAILRSKDETIWQQLQTLDLASFMADINWDSTETMNWNRADILHYLGQISNIETVSLSLLAYVAFVDAVYDVFNRMRLMMKNKIFREMILRGEIVVLSTIVDYNRRPRVLLPLVA
ncbi:MAG: hypothetical protein WAU07_02030, partial [Microgenomates group bacterium]